jgi:hypothetical protein
VAAAVKAASVAVFPSMPAGFSAGGGVSAAAVVGVAAGGTAAGTAIIVAGGDEEEAAPPTPSSGGQTAPASPTTTTTTTTTTTLPPNEPPRAVFTTDPDPPKGQAPLKVKFRGCRSSDPDGDDLQFSYDFGDGNGDSGSCRVEHTYEPDSSRNFNARCCVSDGRPGHEDCVTFQVQVTVPHGHPLQSEWLSLSSTLSPEGAFGQVILNHEHGYYPEGGASHDLSFLPRDTNVVQAQVVRASGEPGSWHFRLPAGTVVPGSLRAVAGQIEALTDTGISFRLKGEPGERLVFVFRHRR